MGAARPLCCYIILFYCVLVGLINKVSVFGKSLFQPEYRILKKAFEEKLAKEAIMRLFYFRDDIIKLDLSPSAIVVECAK